jgi:hypothetical protein
MWDVALVLHDLRRVQDIPSPGELGRTNTGAITQGRAVALHRRSAVLG